MKLRPMIGQDLDAMAGIQERITAAPVSGQWREKPARHVGDELQSGIVAGEHSHVLGSIFGSDFDRNLQS
ncbi:MAG: hypothetical protein PVG03_00905 [Desulfarculaceae bacterium]